MSQQINPDNLPKHIAIIMDGNGRWAKGKGAARLFGHKHAISSVKDVTEACGELGIKYLTLYTFSTENWGRPKMEVDGLMSLLLSTINDQLDSLIEKDVCLDFIGDITSLPEKVHKKLLLAKERTVDNKGLKLILALNYSGRWDLANAIKCIASESKSGDIDIEDIDIKLISSYLSTKNIPDPELLIRTSGEMRISNFLLWEMAYTELYFTNTLWPDFGRENLYEAIISYQNRERRFGKTSEQLNIS